MDGFKCLFTGLKFVYSEHVQLAKFYLIPMFVGFFVCIGGMIFFYFNVQTIVDWFWAEPLSKDWDWQWLWAIVHFFWQVTNVILWILLAVISAVVAYLMLMLATAPLNDLISEQVEGILGTWESRPFSFGFMVKDLGSTIVLELVRLSIKAVCLLPLLILSWLIPVVGQIIYVIVGGYLLSRFLGMDYVDWSLARRGYSWSERFQFAKQNKWALLGFGSAMSLALFIPFAFILVWPGAVAGGTILCTRLNPEDKTEKQSDGVDKKDVSQDVSAEETDNEPPNEMENPSQDKIEDDRKITKG